MLTFKLIKSRLQTSLRRSFGRPRLLLQTTNSLYNFGIRSSPILRTWSSQQSLLWLRVKHMVVKVVMSQHFLIGDLILKIRRRHRRYWCLLLRSRQRSRFVTVWQSSSLKYTCGPDPPKWLLWTATYFKFENILRKSNKIS